MMEKAAIVFVHIGCQSYFDDVVQYSRKFNPGHKIVILGDESNRSIAEKHNAQHCLYSDYTENWDYKHISVNPLGYEKCCLERWIVLKNWLIQHPEIEQVFHSDSDNVLLQDVAFMQPCLDSYDILSFDHNDCIVPNMFIAKRNVILHLGHEIIRFYQQSREEIMLKYVRQTIKHRPHISDMYLLPFLLKPFSILNLDSFPESVCFNSNISEIRHKWVFENGYCYVDGRKLCNIHFQGNAKHDLKRFMGNL